MLPRIQRPPPGRHVVFGFTSILDPLAKYLDYFLSPYVSSMRTYIKDIAGFILKVENMPFDDQYLLATMDVTSLYTNILCTKAIGVAELQKRNGQSPSTSFLI